VASRAPGNAGTELFAGHAVGIIADEQKLHEFLLADLGLDPAVVERAEPAPATVAYTSYLLSAVRGGSYAEGIGAILPCYWIYWEVGKELSRRGSPSPRYQRWIDTYRQRGLRDVGPAPCWASPTARPGPGRGRAGAGAPALPDHQPVRVDVLGHGLPRGDLAGLSRAGQTGGVRRATPIALGLVTAGRRGTDRRAGPGRTALRGHPGGT
jgi:hypothetical protein